MTALTVRNAAIIVFLSSTLMVQRTSRTMPHAFNFNSTSARRGQCNIPLINNSTSSTYCTWYFLRWADGIDTIQTLLYQGIISSRSTFKMVNGYSPHSNTRLLTPRQHQHYKPLLRRTKMLPVHYSVSYTTFPKTKLCFQISTDQPRRNFSHPPAAQDHKTSLTRGQKSYYYSRIVLPYSKNGNRLLVPST